MDRGLYLSTIALLFISLLSVYSLSIYPTIYFGTSEYFFFKKQLYSVIISILILTIISKMNPYRVFKPLGFTIFIGSFIAFAVMLLLPENMVKAVLGAKRWISFGFFSFAPVEFFKYGFIFFISWSLARKYNALYNTKSFTQEVLVLLPYFFILFVAVAFIAVAQKDLGQVVVITISLLALILLAGGSKKLFFSLFSMAIVLFITLILVAPHRLHRFKGWWVGIQEIFKPILPNSFIVTDTAVPYHIINSLKAIEGGGLFGRGIGEGQYKLGFLSEVHTDFIISGLSEEIGFLGISLIFILYFYILYRIFNIGSKLKKLEDKFFVYGVAIVIFISGMINMYGISGLIPIKGIAIPLLSYGGSQIIATSLAISMVLMLSRKVEK